MLHFVCAMAYGDCLITLSQLEQATASEDRWQLIGTGVTRRVSQLLRRPLPVAELLADKAAFYTIKERGPAAAVSDFLRVRAELKKRCAPGDRLAFERRDLRNSALIPPGCSGVFAPRSQSAYDDRRALVQALLGTTTDWAPVGAPALPVRRVTINPCARYRRRWLSRELIDNVVRLTQERGWQLTLIDPCGQYAAWASQVQTYLPRPDLTVAAQALRDSDLYLGPDSFFIHLAHYYRVPHFGFYYPDHQYFLTPGMRELGNFLGFGQAREYPLLEHGVRSFLDRGA